MLTLYTLALLAGSTAFIYGIVRSGKSRTGAL